MIRRVQGKESIVTIDIVKPENLGISSKRLERLTTWLNEQVSSERVAGASVLLSRFGQTAFFKTAGYADAESQKPFEKDTIVRIFSMTKPVTTVAAMMLFEEGCFQLDDPVSLYIPGFADMPVWRGGEIDDVEPQQQPVTIRHVMTHTSGLTYGFMRTNPVDAKYRELGLEFTNHDETLADWTDRLVQTPLICQPGTQWNYSVSSDVLGRLVEIWSGQTLAEFFDKRIFKPLGMVDTGFFVREENHDRFSSLYVPPTGGSLAGVGSAATGVPKPTGIHRQEAFDDSRYLKPTNIFSGGGGLTSTMADYANFCQALLGGGELKGERILGCKTIEFMRLNQLPDGKDMAAMGQPVWSETSYDGIGFGLGWAVVLDPVKAHAITSAGEHHWGGAASTFFWIDPDEDLFVVFLTQLMPSSTYPIRRELRQRVYQSLVE